MKNIIQIYVKQFALKTIGNKRLELRYLVFGFDNKVPQLHTIKSELLNLS